MSDTKLLIEKIKILMTEVMRLPDQRQPNQEAVERLKGVINALHLGMGPKMAAKTASPTPKSFDSAATEYLYGLKPDVESGELGGEGWFGLYLGSLLEEQLTSLPQQDLATLKRNRGAIIHESPEGDVTGQFFPLEEDAVDAWEDAISVNDPELAHP